MIRWAIDRKPPTSPTRSLTRSSAAGSLTTPKTASLATSLTTSLTIAAGKALRALRQEEGANLVLIALMMVTLLGFTGIAIDGSNIYYQQQRMQIAADAAALGGTRLLAMDATEAEVNSEIRSLAFANAADQVDWNFVSAGRGVNVVAQRTIESYFARMFGFETFTVSATSEAHWEPVAETEGLFPITITCDCVEDGEIIYIGDNHGSTTGDDTTPDYSDPAYNDASPQTVVVDLDDNFESAYEFTFVSLVGNTWTYQVRELQGRDLSHWLLNIPSCLGNITSFAPGGAEIGIDGSTGVPGIKWNVAESFTQGQFSFTLDGAYPIGVVNALAKAGPNFGTTPIKGPICDDSDPNAGDSGGGDDIALCLPTIDFERDDAGGSLVVGQKIVNQWAGWGIHVSTHNPSAHPAMIFGSGNPTGNDWHLGTPNEGFGGPGKGAGGGPGMPGANSVPQNNVLIISEDGNSANPDDNAGGWGGGEAGAIAAGLGWMGHYNVIVFENLATQSDIRGRTFVGGTYTSGNGFSMAHDLSGIPAHEVSLEIVGVVPGSGNPLNVNRGSIRVGPGNAVAPGDSGKYMINNRIFNTNQGGANAAIDTGLAAKRTTIQGQLETASSILAGATANNTAVIPTNQHGPLRFIINQVDENGIAVFNVAGSQVFNNNRVQQLEFINNAGAVGILINVSGGSITFNQGNKVGNWPADRILWNFHEATTLNFQRAFRGGLLAPYAALSATTRIDGSVVARTLNPADIHLPNFGADLSWLGSTDADDGGHLIFTFDIPIRVDEVHVVGIRDDEGAGTVTLYEEPGGGDPMIQQRMLGLGANSWQIVPLDGVGVRRMEVSFPRGGAMTAIVFCRSQLDPRYRIGDLIWADTNGNGIFEEGEQGIPDVKVELYVAGQADRVAWTTTDSSGKYMFANLPPGSYEVKLPADNFGPGGPLAETLYSPGNPFDAATGTATVALPGPNGDNLEIDGGFMLPPAQPVGPDQGTVVLPDNQQSTYEFTLVEHNGPYWRYRVREVRGRDLSHWNLLIGNCVTPANLVVSHTSPPHTQAFSAGRDGSTNTWGVKWDLHDNFSVGEFSFTLDRNYHPTVVQVLAKAGPNHAAVSLIGPDCSNPVTGGDPTPTPTPTPVPDPGDPEVGGPGDPNVGGDMCSFGWLDWNGGASTNMELHNNILDTSRSGSWQIGQVIPPGPKGNNSALISSALAQRKGDIVKIPLSQFDGSGYAICGFAYVRLVDYDLSPADSWFQFDFLRGLIRGLTTDPNHPDYGARDVRMLR